MAETNSRFFEFGEFKLDAHRRILRKNDETVHLTPRSFDLLCVMVENAGRILEHDELLDLVWAGTFVEQSNLKKTISALRHALGESPESSEFITTVPRRGYRFTAPVRTLSDETILIRETRAEIFVEEEIEDSPVQVPLLESKNNRSFQNRKIIFAALGLIILGAISYSVWHFLHKPAQRFSVDKVNLTRFLSADNILNGVLSDDGNLFVYRTVENGVTYLHSRQTATGGATRIYEIRDASIWFFTISPDGQYVYFTLFKQADSVKTGLYRVSTFGGAAQLIFEKEISGLKFSPDGKRLSIIHTFIESGFEIQELLSINPENGGDERKITVLPRYHLFRGFAWSPDGNSITYGAKIQPSGEKIKYYIAEIPADGGEAKIILPEQEKFIFFESWLSDKNSFLFRQREPNAEIYQIWQYFPATGEMSRVTKDDYFYNSLTVAQNGKIIGGTRNFTLSSVWISDENSDNLRQIASGIFAYNILKWTADNRLLISTMENGAEYVGIMNTDGANKRLLTKGDDGIRLEPSENGKTINFISNRGGGRDVWQIDFEGRNLMQITNGTEIGTARVLSDDQTVIYLAYPKTKTWCLFKRSADGKTVQLTETNTQDWEISYDEKYLAYYGEDVQTKKTRLFIRDLASGAIIKTFDIDSDILRWTRDNSAITFTRINGGKTEIINQPLDGSAEKIITTIQDETVYSFDWSPDGKQFALVRGKNQAEAVLIRVDEIR